MSEQELMPKSTIEAYNPFIAQLAELEQHNASLVFDYDDEAGAKEAKKHIRELKKTKSALEKVRKDEKKNSLEYGRRVDSEAKAIASRVDGMIDVHAKPLQEIEDREEARKNALKERVRSIYAIGEDSAIGIAEIKKTLERVNSVVVDNSYQEYKASAALAKQETIELLEIKLAEEIEHEELEELRRAEEEKAQAEREEHLMKEAAEKAKREAEEKAAAEIKRIEDEHAAALAAKKAEEAKAEEAEARRQANKKHREKIHAEIFGALNEIVPGASESILEAIEAGDIPHVSINY